MDNKWFLTIIGIILIGIFTVVFVQMNQKPKTIGEHIDSTVEDVQDKIDNHTTDN